MPDQNTPNGDVQGNNENTLNKNNSTANQVNVGSKGSPFIASALQALEIEKIPVVTPAESILNAQIPKQGEVKTEKGVMENLTSKIEDSIPDVQKNLMNKPIFVEKKNAEVNTDIKEKSIEKPVAVESQKAVQPQISVPVAKENIDPNVVVPPVQTNQNVQEISPISNVVQNSVPTKTASDIQNSVQNQSFAPNRNVTPVQKPVSQTKRPVKKNSSFGILFGGILMFIILLALWGASYMLSQNNGEFFKSYGLTQENITSVKLGIQTGFGFIGIMLILILLIAGMMLGGGKGKNGKRKGGGGLVFSLVFLVLTGVFFSSSVKMLSKIQTIKPDITEQGQTNFSQYVTVHPNPTIGSAPFEVTLDASAIENSKSGFFYEWDFGDGTPAGNGYQIRHTYDQTGIFSVSLFISDGTGQSQEIDANIVVTVNNAKPKPIVTVDVTEGELPLVVNFDASQSRDESGIISEYRWNFDDLSAQVNYAKGVQATHTFESPGVHEVTLTVIDNNNESVSTVQTITVLSADEGLQPKIVYSPKDGVAPLKVSFNASGTTHSDEDVSITNYLWNFGDGTKEEENKIVKHIFKETGTYIVTLTVTDSNDEIATEEVEVVIESADDKPIPVILTTPTELSGQVPFIVTFDGSNSKDEDGDVTNYSWEFTDSDDVEYGKTVEHTFEEEGEYIVTLQVTDNDDNSTEKSVVITVLSAGPQDPIAVLTTSPDPAQGIRPFVVDLDASESYDPDGNIIAYIWNFGEGGANIQTSSPKTSHTFDKVGIWKIQLTVHDDTGAIGVTNLDVAVNSSKPKAKITVDADVLKANIDILFSGRQSTGEIKEYNWKFGDGTSDKGIEVKHMFTAPGKYDVSLVVSDEVGQSNTYEMEVVVE